LCEPSKAHTTGSFNLPLARLCGATLERKVEGRYVVVFNVLLYGT
jgi:hypothetical protein